MRPGNQEAAGWAMRVLPLLVLAIGAVYIGNAFAGGEKTAPEPCTKDAGADVVDEDAGEIRIPLDKIEPEDPLIRARAVAAVSLEGESENWGGAFHLAVAPWVTQRFSGFLDFGVRRYDEHSTYVELAAVPTLTVHSCEGRGIDIAPVLGGAMGYFDHEGKRIQLLMGAELGRWWTVAGGSSPGSSAEYPRRVNELKDWAERYRVRCKDNDGEASECQEYKETIALILEEIDHGGHVECALPRKKRPLQIPQLLARVDRCLSAIADRRRTDDTVRVGLNFRLTRITGRGLPSLLTFDLGLGVAY